MKKSEKWVVACGNPDTARAAAEILEQGGNAYDAIVAAHAAACISEPVLSSLGGGGFMLARTHSGKSMLYDFFVQTPFDRPQDKAEFYGINADFGGQATQEFHIGMASIAVPGSVRGMFRILNDLGSLSPDVVFGPAIRMAREGIEFHKLQAYIFDIVEPIYRATKGARDIFMSSETEDALIREGERFRVPEMAETFEALARDGDALFYEGEIARMIERDVAEKGATLSRKDLNAYRVDVHEPLSVSYRDASFLTNSPPSTGGILIGFALKLLESLQSEPYRARDAEFLTTLIEVMAATNRSRSTELNGRLFDRTISERMYDPELIARYKQDVVGRVSAFRGTTHFSVIDGEGNLASMTVSNGEGSGYVVPGTGIMTNNMLGEEDVNPHGFFKWQPDTRVSSMMSPSILVNGDRHYAIGSGGSNRIRTAILQTALNLIDKGDDPTVAVAAPRVHFERDVLNLEPGFDDAIVSTLTERYPNTKIWERKDLFFGGVHVAFNDEATGEFSGAADERRGGVVLTNS